MMSVRIVSHSRLTIGLVTVLSIRGHLTGELAILSIGVGSIMVDFTVSDFFPVFATRSGDWSSHSHSNFFQKVLEELLSFEVFFNDNVLVLNIWERERFEGMLMIELLEADLTKVEISALSAGISDADDGSDTTT